MKKICLSITGIVLTFFAAFAQPATNDSSIYKRRKLTFEEANIVSSYYRQDGDHAAVMGGSGSEKLTDFSNSIEVKLTRWGKRDIKHTYDLEVGIDHYTSASSDMVNPLSISSASHADTRIYPSLNWTAENEKKGSTIGAAVSFSTEFDYQSMGFNLHMSKKTHNRMGEFTAKAQVYLDQLKYIIPVELRPPGNQDDDEDEDDYASKSRNSYSGSLSYSQIINKQFQVMLIADLVYQEGFLGLPFHRVYFKDNSVHIENLPGTRTKIPLGIRANYFAGDKIIFRTFYRYYQDSWGLKAHTAELETTFKLNPFFSITPFYRFYNQTAVDYFTPNQLHTAADKYYTSNYDLSAFRSDFYGAGFRLSPAKGVFGIERLGMLEVRYGHYSRTDGLNSDILSLHLKFK